MRWRQIRLAEDGTPKAQSHLMPHEQLSQRVWQAPPVTEARLQRRNRQFARKRRARCDGLCRAGGKKLRGFLVMESARCMGSGQEAVQAAAAIEAIHAYSLVHDDLPAMDDDDLRRGQPTVHVQWDEATAILAGDALQTLAFGLLARPDAAPTPRRRLDLIASACACRRRGRDGAGPGAGSLPPKARPRPCRWPR
jgi:geranylgeranyl pyrophosphate synthase